MADEIAAPARARIDLALAALADPTRRGVVEALRARPLSVGAIAERLPVSRPAVSQHLRTLREAGVVVEMREGTRHIFALDPATALALRNHFEGMWRHALRAYAAHVDREERRRSPRRRPAGGNR